MLRPEMCGASGDGTIYRRYCDARVVEERIDCRVVSLLQWRHHRFGVGGRADDQFVPGLQ